MTCANSWLNEFFFAAWPLQRPRLYSLKRKIARHCFDQILFSCIGTQLAKYLLCVDDSARNHQALLWLRVFATE
jgi:hypothetical protein